MRVPWETILTRRAASPLRPLTPFLRGKFLALGVVALVCAALAGGDPVCAAGAASDDPPGAELSRLARSLRTTPTSQNYKRLADFAVEYRESELSAQAAFALGMSDFEQKRWSAARVWFDDARSSYRLRDYATYYLASAEAELGALESARRRLTEFSFAGGTLEEDALVLRATLWLRGAEPAKAVEWLQQQPNLPDRPALLLVLGQAQQAAGREAQAAATLQRVYYEFPLSPQAEPANQVLGQLRESLKSNYPTPGEALLRSRAETLWAGRAFRGARSAYTELGQRAGEPLRTEARLRAASALYRLGSVTQACRELDAIGPVPSGLEAEYRSQRARCAIHEERSEKAEADLGFLEKKFPTTEWCAEALRDAAVHALARGDKRGAHDYYRRLVEASPGSDAAVEAQWKLSWLAYRERKTDEATRLLEEHLTRFPQSPFLPRALYWRARVAADAGQNELANHLLAQLRRLAPRDYLAQQAEQIQPQLRGGAGDGSRALPAWLQHLALPNDRPSTAALPAPARARLDRAAALDRLGFGELADRELGAALQQSDHPDIQVARARVAIDQQKFAVATQRLSVAFPGYWRYQLSDLPREAWEIMFPRPYWDIIQREARRNGLDPFLVAALIRQESRFEVEARSSAGALGLMQLMPATARHLAQRRNLSTRGILDPELNIRLGTRFLAQLLARFNGNVEKAVAGYNAGGTRVAQWVTDNGADDIPEFVESIPVTQTREFVYIVLRNHRFYRDLYSQPAAAGQP